MDSFSVERISFHMAFLQNAFDAQQHMIGLVLLSISSVSMSFHCILSLSYDVLKFPNAKAYIL